LAATPKEWKIRRHDGFPAFIRNCCIGLRQLENLSLDRNTPNFLHYLTYVVATKHLRAVEVYYGAFRQGPVAVFFADIACVARACDATALGRASIEMKLVAITH
jgi:hypothetical protein